MASRSDPPGRSAQQLLYIETAVRYDADLARREPELVIEVPKRLAGAKDRNNYRITSAGTDRTFEKRGPVGCPADEGAVSELSDSRRDLVFYNGRFVQLVKQARSPSRARLERGVRPGRRARPAGKNQRSPSRSRLRGMTSSRCREKSRRGTGARVWSLACGTSGGLLAFIIPASDPARPPPAPRPRWPPWPPRGPASPPPHRRRRSSLRRARRSSSGRRTPTGRPSSRSATSRRCSAGRSRTRRPRAPTS